MTPSEARTKQEQLDPALSKDGWNLADSAQVGIEIPVDGYDAQPWNGITDYCLYRDNGEVLAVVEAKKQLRDPNVAREQARHYITELQRLNPSNPSLFLRTVWKSIFGISKTPAPGSSRVSFRFLT